MQYILTIKSKGFTLYDHNRVVLAMYVYNARKRPVSDIIVWLDNGINPSFHFNHPRSNQYESYAIQDYINGLSDGRV